jgi:PAS domain S-box-containing protein
MAKKPTDEELEERVKGLEKKAGMRKALTDALFDAVFLFEKGVCIDQNQAAARLFGYTLAEAIGRRVTNWVVPGDRDQVKNNMLSGYEKPYEIVALCKDGTTVPCEIQARRINYKGRSTQVTAFRDITALKKVQESEAKFRGFVESSSDWLWEVNAKGVYTYASLKVEEMIGFKPEEIIGKTPFDFMPPEEVDHKKAPHQPDDNDGQGDSIDRRQ